MSNPKVNNRDNKISIQGRGRYIIVAAIINAIFIVFIEDLHRLELELNLPAIYSLRDFIAPQNIPSNIINIEINQNSFLKIDGVRECIQHNRGRIDFHCFPRRLHGDLLRKLKDNGATLVIFNLLFLEDRGEEDIYFADAIRETENVVLQDYQERRFIGTGMEIVDVALPPPILADNAVSAPLPIPDSQLALPKLWLFLDMIRANGESAESVSQPILPVVAFHLLVIKEYGRQIADILEKVAPELASAFAGCEKNCNRYEIHQLIEHVSFALQQDPQLGQKLSKDWENSSIVSSDTKQILLTLLSIYQSSEDYYLNPYGPAHTFRTVEYHLIDQVLTNEPNQFRDKIVFVGPSLELGRMTKGGVINTPYGQISSTEFTATAFANLQNNNALRLSSEKEVVIISTVWYLVILVALIRFSAKTTLLMLILATIGYLSGTFWLFSVEYRLFSWLPVLLQSVAASIVALTEYYFNQREKLNAIINSAVPPELVENFTGQDFETIKRGAYHHGICMAADGEGYTKLGASRGEKWLADFMLAYQPVVEECVRMHHGAIKDWAGDGMVALWVEKTEKRRSKLSSFLNRRSTASTDIRKQALTAALALTYNAERFGEAWGVSFPLRIGLTYGSMWLSFVDELKAFGDTINSASRIETLNKQTRTHILVSEGVLQGQFDFVVRRVGRFVLRGHSDAINIFELIGVKGTIDPAVLDLVSQFETGLNYFEGQAWKQALSIFAGILSRFPEDGPSKYYYEQCQNQL